MMIHILHPTTARGGKPYPSGTPRANGLHPLSFTANRPMLVSERVAAVGENQEYPILVSLYAQQLRGVVVVIAA